MFCGWLLDSFFQQVPPAIQYCNVHRSWCSFFIFEENLWWFLSIFFCHFSLWASAMLWGARETVAFFWTCLKKTSLPFNSKNSIPQTMYEHKCKYLLNLNQLKPFWIIWNHGSVNVSKKTKSISQNQKRCLKFLKTKKSYKTTSSDWDVLKNRSKHGPLQNQKPAWRWFMIPNHSLQKNVLCQTSTC